jgi:hypothetical protein
MEITKDDRRLIAEALLMYRKYLWQMANASYLGGNVPLVWMPKYDRFSELEEYVLSSIKKGMKDE